jgi:hypothetical protein
MPGLSGAHSDPPGKDEFPPMSSPAELQRCCRLFLSPRLVQRVCEVGNQIRRVFDPDRESDEPVINPNLGSPFGRNARMGHYPRMLDETFNAAKTFGECENSAALQKSLGAV